MVVLFGFIEVRNENGYVEFFMYHTREEPTHGKEIRLSAQKCDVDIPTLIIMSFFPQVRYTYVFILFNIIFHI